MRLKTIFRITEKPWKDGILLALLTILLTFASYVIYFISVFFLVLIFMLPSGWSPNDLSLNTSLAMFYSLLMYLLYSIINLFMFISFWRLFAKNLPFTSPKKVLITALIGISPRVAYELFWIAFKNLNISEFLTFLILNTSIVLTLIYTVYRKDKEIESNGKLRLNAIFSLTENPLRDGMLLALLNFLNIFIIFGGQFLYYLFVSKLFILISGSSPLSGKINTISEFLSPFLLIFYILVLPILIIVCIIFAKRLPLPSFQKRFLTAFVGAAPFLIFEVIYLPILIYNLSYNLSISVIAMMIFYLSSFLTIIYVGRKHLKEGNQPNLSLG